MKTYPSIGGIRKIVRGEVYPMGSPCLAFYKFDGSNIRAEWSRKRGWYKFGTRKTMIDGNTPFWSQVIPLWRSQIAEQIERVLRDKVAYRGAESVVAFAEFFGEGSFAGQHLDSSPKMLKLFDINVHKRGFVSPRQFADDFDESIRAPVVYSGDLTLDYINSVRETTDVLDEGVVVKGGEGHSLWMSKIKTQLWIDRVKGTYPDNWDKFHNVEDEVDFSK